MPQFTSIHAFMIAVFEESEGNFRVTHSEQITFERRGALVAFNLIIKDEVEEEWVFAAEGEEIEKYFGELERLYA